ncbi:hypothetical protein BYT27DRAFT_7336684 [Phlegmacium glaucopus]|nr:hypothetical protein BYT27DRAFT_7336684 [Phlegmacium glaucopus]
MSRNSTQLTSAFSFNLQVPNFGNGFVELAMLTTLVGSATSETMVLGDHGAAGLAWATMSAFGTGRIISACLSGACTPWLREIMGLRSKINDSSLGMELSSNVNTNIANIIRSRYAADGLLALSVDSRETCKEAGGKLVWKEIYAFDHPTSRLIKNMPEAGSSSFSIAAHKEFSVDRRNPFSSSSASIRSDKSLSSSSASIRSDKSFSSSTDTISGEGINLSVYTYAPYQYYPQHHMKFQLLMLGLSFLKVGECFALWWLSGGPLLSLATALPWMYFIIVAVIVEVSDLNKTRTLQDPDSYIDMVSGHLPKMTPAGAGGERKIILGVSQNARTTARWKIMWGIGVLVCLPTVVFTYTVLSHESNKVLFLWLFFQFLWTFVRIIVHHFAEPMNNSLAADEQVLVERSWSTLPSPLKHRVMKLMSALASHLTLVHRRREIAYRTAAVAPEELRTIIFHSSPRLYYPLPQDIESFAAHKKKLVEIDISAVIGDPVLSSAAWIAGARHLTPTDLYDCCIISFRTYTSKFDPLPKSMTIPCARVLCTIPKITTHIDEEGIRLPGPRQFVPKHMNNCGENWCYFIPCKPGLWLFYGQNMTSEVVGKHTTEALTDIQVTAMLAEGDMNISLSHVDDMKQVVNLSEQARQILLQILVS